ncbi:MAG: glycosyltransferase family 87 protein [Planctomycetota bacterium]
MAASLPRWVVGVSIAVVAAAAVYCTLRVASHTRKHARDATVHRDFDHFYHAAVAASGEAQDPYTSFRSGYIYPPMLAGLLQPIAGLERNRAYVAWFVINAGIIAAAFVLSARALLRAFGVEARAPAVIVVIAAGVLPAFDQLRWQLEQGQTDGLLLLAFAVGLGLAERRPMVAGMLCGLASNIKYLSLIVVPFGLVRWRPRLVLGAAAGAIAGLLLPAFVFGWDRNIGYVRTSLGRLIHVVDAGPDLQNTDGVNIHSLTWELNISLPAFGAKLVSALDLPGVLVPVLAVCSALMLVGIAWWMYRAKGVPFWRAGERPVELRIGEWLGLVVAAMAMSPQITVRHMVLMTLVYQCAAVLALTGTGRARWLSLAGVGVAWLGMTMPPGGGSTWSSEVALPVWRSVSGAMWCALVCYACVLWALLSRAADGQKRGDPPAESGASSPT